MTSRSIRLFLLILVLGLIQGSVVAQTSWKTYRNDELQFRFLYPPDWFFGKPRGPNVKATLFPQNSQPRANCNIVVQNILDTATSSQSELNAVISSTTLSESDWKEMMGMKWPDFRLVESKHVKVDNQPAFYAVVQYSHQTVDRKTYVKGVILQTLTPGHVWTFSCAGKGNIHTEAEQSFRYWKPTFDRILGSLVFESRFDPTNYEDTMTSKSSPAVPLGTIVKSNIDLSQSITTFSGIAVHLPSQWQEIPKDVLTANFEEFAKQNPNLPKQTYEYGFQAPSEQWFSYPYILIQIQRTGRIPEVALKEFPNLAEMFDDELQKTMEVASTVTDAAMGKTIYDSSKRILWTSMRLNYAGIGNVKMLAGGHLSEDGSVYVLGYTKEQDFSKYETLLHQIISSVELPPGMRYVPRISDNIRNSQ